MKAKQAGFTLVEIAIVLVIIGLLLGGILKGQEMIAQAKIKNVITDLNGVTAALNSYQDRYRALPGDDKAAGTGSTPVGRWAADTTVVSGNGDGVITGLYTAASGESAQFWLHLRKAGFISGTGLDVPFNAASGKMGVQNGDGLASTPPGSVFASTGVAGFTGLILCSANLPDKMAISIDSQIDDGNALTGSVRAVEQGGVANPATSIGATLTANYVEDGTKSYLVCRTML